MLMQRTIPHILGGKVVDGSLAGDLETNPCERGRVSSDADVVGIKSWSRIEALFTLCN